MIAAPLVPMPLRMILNDSARAWTIVSGAVDLFLVDVAETVAQSSLDYLGTLDAGSLLLGVGGVLVDGFETTIMAQAASETMLQPIDLIEVDAEYLDSWITNISEWCAPGLAPSASVQVQAGKPVDTGEEGLTLIGSRSVIWLGGATAGLSLYAEAEDHSLAAVPVCRYLWAVAEGGQTLSSEATEQWLAKRRVDGRLIREMASVHAAMLAQRRKKRQRIEDKERGRFQDKVQRDGRVFAGALRELTRPLLPAGANHFEKSSRMSGALEACRAVGEVMGIPIHAPEHDIADEKTEQAIIRIASASGVRYRQVLLRDAWWKQDQGPMVGLTLNGVSAVALLPKNARSYVMLDPLSGTSVSMTEALSNSLDSHAYVLYRSFPNRKLTAKDILLFGLRNGKKDLTTILIVGMMSGLLAMAMPIATGVLFDDVIPEGQRNNLVQLSVILFSASIAMFLMNLGQSFATQRLEGRMESEMEAAVWDRLMNLPTTFFRRFTTGDLASRSLAINQIRQALTGTATSALLTGIFSVFSFALLFSYSVKLALAATGLAACAIVFSIISTLVTVRLDRRILAMQGKIAGRVAELLQGVAKFRVSGTEPRAFARWAHDYTWQKQNMLTAAKVSLATTLFNTVFPAATSILIYVLAANMARQDPSFSTGRFLAFNAAFGQFLGATLGFSAAMLSLVSIVPTYERAKPILEELPELKAEMKKPGALRGDIEVSHAHFRYEKDGPVILKDVSFSIRAGQYIALVGESGCGKSTLMRLLLGFEKPESGSIFYDGQDLAELDMQAVRRQIGVVLQAGKLMQANIHINIVGASLLTMDDAWAAAEAVGLGDDIRAMPMGMYTVINESGSGLSGGQRQRILIARSIVRRPRILFFDEATSALDNHTQSIVSRSLDAMQATRIVIAHRLSTIRHADVILVFKEGRLHESGTYEELVSQNGHFAELAKRQLA
ncbi:NHLP bacteriocin export ABC transporter permease/ATPase subunit [Granulicella sibirica]|uniref:ABC-type bacteriocin n=1 Tax=Granulicella sibirica TaxID=2479048 RepID=A0A4Q0T6N2_9BACT|nr:NHLP bacteriocin export ABC transporter permease/ATPase subunit [Granulicella sibirica]RXH57296.1 ABC-type bacteriocin [Granulicella sibirica]